MQLNEQQILRGEFRLEKRDLNGKVLETYSEQNLIVGTGRQNLARVIGTEQTNRHISKIGFGTNGTAAADGDTALTGAFVKSIDGVTYPESNSVQFAWSLGAGEANGTQIREFGLITAGDVLFARKSREVITKQSDFTLSGTWKIIF